ncbi:inactive peptidyl-prolyl cis-trans isomerase FKBP6 isoform X1 [Hypanus sabinus]|uniref:inactive peptidyl-prolyl cis-trans isomerase FKBP6 isoform X1 n=3 Tax=Hypanus sabinus TaxID=79690 RepID=UPI0028C481F2|nr:inactive peptidyl-prolyl cis-trans isomerase FKBP6 isoform X1 [Hypanus sabinus]
MADFHPFVEQLPLYTLTMAETKPDWAVRTNRASEDQQSPFHYMSLRMQDVAGDGGVLKEVLRPGSGSVIPSTASVSVHYSAYSEYTDRPFDSNMQRNTPRFMKIGQDITLPGMELAILTMRKGEFSRFLFKPEYAYGKMGCPPRIPPNATVMFEIDILDFLDTSESDQYFSLSQAEQINYPLDKLLKIVNTEREFGNYFFHQKQYQDAKDKYKKALSVFAQYQPANEDQKQQIHSSKLLLFLNLSIVCLKLNAPNRALVYGERALQIESKHPKALFRCGQLLSRVELEGEGNLWQDVCCLGASDSERQRFQHLFVFSSMSIHGALVPVHVTPCPAFLDCLILRHPRLLLYNHPISFFLHLLACLGKTICTVENG